MKVFLPRNQVLQTDLKWAKKQGARCRKQVPKPTRVKREKQESGQDTYLRMFLAMTRDKQDILLEILKRETEVIQDVC